MQDNGSGCILFPRGNAVPPKRTTEDLRAARVHQRPDWDDVSVSRATFENKHEETWGPRLDTFCANALISLSWITRLGRAIHAYAIRVADMNAKR